MTERDYFTGSVTPRPEGDSEYDPIDVLSISQKFQAMTVRELQQEIREMEMAADGKETVYCNLDYVLAQAVLEEKLHIIL